MNDPKRGSLARKVSGLLSKKRVLSADKRITVAFPNGKFFYLRNSGLENRIIFSSKEDFDRFEAYLYLLNAVESARAANFFVGGREAGIFTSARGEPLIALGAYSITPTDFHLIATPRIEGGIGKFMQKLQTAYTMYFNRKYQHAGRIFHGAYSANAADSHAHLKYLFANVHLNPARLFDKYWDESVGNEFESLASKAMQYRYSSAGEYAKSKFVICAPRDFPLYLLRAKNAAVHVRFWLQHKKENL